MKFKNLQPVLCYTAGVKKQGFWQERQFSGRNVSENRGVEIDKGRR